jgi:cell division septation protein DedD
MAESGIREIQVSRKQLVFLFMASVVFVVVVFLLGVSVGRGSHSPLAPAVPADLVATTEGPMAAPPNTPTDPAALSYNQLKNPDGSAKPAATATPGTPAGTATATPNPPPAPVTPASAHPVDPPAASAPPKPAPSTAPAVSPAPKSTPPPTVSTSKPTPTPTPAGWYVQVGSFKSSDLADALVTKLKGQGYEAYLVDVPKSLLRVRVGPYAQKSDADNAMLKLKKDGFSSPIVGR